MFFDLFLALFTGPEAALFRWKIEVRPNWTEEGSTMGDGDMLPVVADVGDSW